MERKKKVRLFQISLLVIGLLMFIFIYLQNKFIFDKEILISDKKAVIQEKLPIDGNNNVFYNIEYSGLDLAGNRYILKSKEATNSPGSQEIVNMTGVKSIFYFKDNTILEVRSDEGKYNNKSLDMTFIGNVRAYYNNSKLYADKAEYSNVKSFLTITNNVRIDDFRGTIFADKLLFDIKKNVLEIASFKDGKVNANLNLE